MAFEKWNSILFDINKVFTHQMCWIIQVFDAFAGREDHSNLFVLKYKNLRRN